MASNVPPIPAITCAENIAFLHLLHPVPAQPSSNSVIDFHIPPAGYTLPFETERNLAGTLAFLAYAEDDPNYIPAVCIEEDPKSAYLNVLLAVNKADPNDGNQVLQWLQEGFERLFAILAQVSNGGPSNLEDSVFSAIISLCSARILCRLRFVAKRRKSQNQPSIKEVLREAMESVKQVNSLASANRIPSALAASFEKKAKEVFKLIDGWIKHQTLERLECLVQGIHRLRHVGDLHVLLDPIPNRIMDPLARKSLINILSKVARYREASILLYRTARKFSLARQMRIVLVNLPPQVFDKVPTKEHNPTLESVISRIDGLKTRKKDIINFCRLLNTTFEKANDQFATQTRKTLEKAKIHAEIQLLYHCELNSSGAKRVPRVVCSSKDACWLCNEFILMYRKIYTPKSHGRHYPGWRLPTFPRTHPGDHHDMARSFNQVLQHHIKLSFQKLFLGMKRTVYPDPNESTLLTLPRSMSTLPSLAPSRAIVGNGADIDDDEQVGETTDRDEGGVNSIVTRNDNPSQASSASPHDDIVPQRTLSATATISSTGSGIVSLSQGLIISKSIRVNKDSPLYTAGPLEVQIEYSKENEHNSHQRRLGYTVEWLTVEEARRLQGQSFVPIVNAESLQGETSLGTDKRDCIYLAAGGAVLRIIMQPIIRGNGIF